MKGIKEVVAELGNMAEKAGHDAAGAVTGSAVEMLERVGRKIDYVPDPVAVEWYGSPARGLAELLDPQTPPVRADADDAAVLLAAAMLAAGHTCRIVAQSFGGGFENALVHVRVEGEWRRADALQGAKLDEVHPHTAELLGRVLEPRT